MDDRERSFSEALEYRTAVRHFECAFAACERLHHEDRVSLLKEIAKRLLQQLPPAPSAEPKTVQIMGIEIKSGD